MNENNNTNVLTEEVKNIKDVDLTKYKIIGEETVYQDIEGGKKEVKLIYMEKENRYYLNLKKAKDAYNERNREKVSEQSNERHKKRYQNDPEYREKIKAKRREQYYKNKDKNNKKNEDTNI
jgi:hypothetical protein